MAEKMKRLTTRVPASPDGDKFDLVYSRLAGDVKDQGGRLSESSLIRRYVMEGVERDYVDLNLEEEIKSA